MLFVGGGLGAEEPNDVQQQLRLLLQQNQSLQEQLRKQQIMIDSLTSKMGEIQSNQTSRSRELESSESAAKPSASTPKDSGGFNLGKVNISGEGSVGILTTGSEGKYPHTQFRLNEARLFVEAPIWNDVYFYSELDMATPEEQDVQLRLGEIYLDVENVSQLWGREGTLNVRAGRMYVPYGEEYLSRYAIDNPLISRSLTDLWGVNAGLEFYGRLGKFSYVVAAENGGISDTQDFESDKSVAGRLGYDPTRWLHVSVSGMRTGDLSVSGDYMSAMWFGNGFFRSIGSTQTTTFHANLVEGDVDVSLPRGHVKAFGGYIRYDDNDPTANNGRDVYYYSVEGMHDLTRKLYAGARFSQILAPGGFPLTGYGDFGDYFLNTLSTELWRLSLGVGYRWSPNLVLKAEYTFERGKDLGGDSRKHEDFVGAEAAFRF